MEIVDFSLDSPEWNSQQKKGIYNLKTKIMKIRILFRTICSVDSRIILMRCGLNQLQSGRIVFSKYSLCVQRRSSTK